MRRLIAALTLVLWPSAVHACSVCFSATDQNRMAFLLTTIVLSFLPLGMIGSGLWWLKRRSDELEIDREDGDQP